MKKVFIFLIVFLSSFLFSEDKAVKFGKAIELYLKGNYAEVIPVVEGLLKQEPDNKKAKDLYFRALKNLAKEYEKDKKYNEAYNCVKKALKRKPDDKELKESLSRLKGLLSEKEEEKKIIKKSRVKKKIKKSSQRKKGIKKKIERTKENKKDLSRATKEKNISKGKAKKEKKKKIVKKDKNKEKYPPGKLSPLIYVILSLNFIGIVFLSYLFISQSPKKEEEKLLLQERRISQLVDSLSREEQYDVILRQQKKIMEMLERIPRAENTIKEQSQELIKLIEKLTKGQKTVKIELPPGSGREVLTDVNPLPRVRADAVELIGDMFDDPVIVEEMLEPYLSDDNNRVLANACKVLFKYNRRRAFSILKDMINSSDKWMRMSGAWVLGEIAEEEVVNYLKILLNDNERQVKVRAVKSFWKLKKKGIIIPRDIELKIQEIEKEENLKRE